MNLNIVNKIYLGNLRTKQVESFLCARHNHSPQGVSVQWVEITKTIKLFVRKKDIEWGQTQIYSYSRQMSRRVGDSRLRTVFTIPKALSLLNWYCSSISEPIHTHFPSCLLSFYWFPRGFAQIYFLYEKVWRVKNINE